MTIINFEEKHVLSNYYTTLGFGRSKSYFNNYFAGYNREIKDSELELYRKARNLLYVAATRARINLRILYTGDYQSKKEIFDCIFGEVALWEKEDDDSAI